MNDKKKALLVVDDRNTSEYMIPTLQNKGYETKEINSDDRVLETIQSYGPDIILIDETLNKTDVRYLYNAISDKDLNKEAKVVCIGRDITKNHNGNTKRSFDNLRVMPFTVDEFDILIDRKVVGLWI